MNLRFLFFVPIVLAGPGLAVDEKQRSKYTKFWINISPKTLITSLLSFQTHVGQL